MSALLYSIITLLFVFFLWNFSMKKSHPIIQHSPLALSFIKGNKFLGTINLEEILCHSHELRQSVKKYVFFLIKYSM